MTFDTGTFRTQGTFFQELYQCAQHWQSFLSVSFSFFQLNNHATVWQFHYRESQRPRITVHSVLIITANNKAPFIPYMGSWHIFQPISNLILPAFKYWLFVPEQTKCNKRFLLFNDIFLTFHSQQGLVRKTSFNQLGSKMF